jgi:hypothetical protein
MSVYIGGARSQIILSSSHNGKLVLLPDFEPEAALELLAEDFPAKNISS